MLRPDGENRPFRLLAMSWPSLSWVGTIEKTTSTVAKLKAALQHRATSGRVTMSDQATALASVDFDKARFAATLKTRALPPYGSGQCAKYVRIALEAAGMATGPNPRLAKDYGP